MGAGGNVNAFFGMMTVFIALPTSVQVISWISTMIKGKINFKSPMFWFFGFLSTFIFGGLVGVLMAIPPADFQIHNSLFLVAHFHTMIIGGALFGIFAAFTYWFPKAFGIRLNERLGKYAFWGWLVGFFVAFVPLYMLGLMGATRRLDHYTNPSWQLLFITSFVGICILGIGFGFQVLQILVSIKDRKKLRDETGDPWNGRTLEWSVPSPAPFYNFAVIPQVKSLDAWWEMKKSGEAHKKPKFEDIHIPKNTSLGMFAAAFCFIIGFAMVWHIFWVALIGLIGAVAVVIVRSLDEHTEYVLPASEVEKIELSLGRKYD
jgi:cytochrome o ubiquinol oxidase subunit I